MRKLKYIIITLCFSLLLFNVAQAAILKSETANKFKQNTDTFSELLTQFNFSTSLEDTISSVIRLALSLIGTIFIVLMFVAGNNWMQAAGNEEKVKKSKETIRNLLIGMCLILVAYALSSGLGGILAKAFIKSN